MKNKVQCKSCLTEYNSADEHMAECNQADTCAAEVHFKDNEIVCYYGSGYDTDVYEFTEHGVPDWIESGAICDECIEKLIKGKSIRYKEERIW